MKNRKWPIILLMAICLLTGSCENSFVAHIDGKELAIVLGVIDIEKDNCYIRLTRSWNGSGNALEFAKNADSVYFQEVDMVLEQYYGEHLVWGEQLIQHEIEPREAGPLLESPNRFYSFSNPGYEHRGYHPGLLAGGKDDLKLTIDIEGYPGLVFAQTKSIRDPVQLVPLPDYWDNKIGLYSDPGPRFTAIFFGPHNELRIAFRYLDVIDDQYYEREIAWRLMRTMSTGEHEAHLNANTVMTKLSKLIPYNPEVEYRYSVAFDIYFISIDDFFEPYIRSFENTGIDQTGLPLSNIVNGIGAFCAYSERKLELVPDAITRDSISRGLITRQLKFVPYLLDTTNQPGTYHPLDRKTPMILRQMTDDK